MQEPRKNVSAIVIGAENVRGVAFCRSGGRVFCDGQRADNTELTALRHMESSGVAGSLGVAGLSVCEDVGCMILTKPYRFHLRIVTRNRQIQ